MVETTADVRRDIEMTRDRMSDTLAQLEQKLNVVQVVKDHPWPALALAVGAGFALAGSRADVKAAAAAVRATEGAGSKLGGVLDDLAASVIGSVSGAFQHRVNGWVAELKEAIGAPAGGRYERSTARGSETRSAGIADRQLLGTDDGARREGGGQLAGLDATTRDGGTLRAPGSRVD